MNLLTIIVATFALIYGTNHASASVCDTYGVCLKTIGCSAPVGDVGTHGLLLLLSLSTVFTGCVFQIVACSRLGFLVRNQLIEKTAIGHFLGMTGNLSNPRSGKVMDEPKTSDRVMS
jgi:hypothetical protein